MYDPSKSQTAHHAGRYNKDHGYITVEDGAGTVGITSHAHEQLSDVTELPHVGAQVQKGGTVDVVESVKAASALFSSVSGEILGVNETLTGKPELVSEDAEGGLDLQDRAHRVFRTRYAFGSGSLSRLRAGARLRFHSSN
jgi:glycine cleavage system H protein